MNTPLHQYVKSSLYRLFFVFFLEPWRNERVQVLKSIVTSFRAIKAEKVLKTYVFLVSCLTDIVFLLAAS